jgi:uncharacterized protein (TIGR02118 family)
MIKRISLVRRKAGMRTSEFERYWLESHRTLALRLPGLRGYRINFPREWRPAPVDPWDGLAEVWFDSTDAMNAAFDELSAELARDRERFVGEVVSVIVEEHVALAEIQQ